MNFGFCSSIFTFFKINFPNLSLNLRPNFANISNSNFILLDIVSVNLWTSSQGCEWHHLSPELHELFSREKKFELEIIAESGQKFDESVCKLILKRVKILEPKPQIHVIMLGMYITFSAMVKSVFHFRGLCFTLC